MACIFCGEDRKASTEHVVPVWLGPVLEQAQPPTGVAPGGKRMTHRFTPAEGDDSPGLEWSSEGPSLVSKAVCSDCNSGWLSDLETAAAPVVRRLVTGEKVVLSGEEQRVVATWSYKTVLLLQMTRREAIRSMPPARFQELYVLRRPPADVRVWLGAALGNNAMHETSTEINLATPQITVPGFFTGLALGMLLILCAGRIADGPERIRVGSRGHTKVTAQVWPASVHPVEWPPTEALTDLRAKALVALL